MTTTSKKTTAASRSALNRLTALFAALCVVFSLCGCSGSKGDDWITAPTASQSQPTASEQDGAMPGEAFEGEYDAPRFQSGTYMMTTTASNQQDYTDADGNVVYSYGMMTRYVYKLDMTVDNGITCRYTFDSIYGSSTADGESSVEIDTKDNSLINDSNVLFYKLIGQSFTISADANGKLTGISGIPEICTAVPGAEQLINEELLYNMAGDIFYEMPEKLSCGSTWQVEQYGIKNTYRAERMARGMFGITLDGGDSGIPDPTTDDSGYTTTYTSVAPITGTLWLDTSDRAVQELTTNQRSTGMIANSENSGAYFTLTSTTSSSVTRA